MPSLPRSRREALTRVRERAAIDLMDLAALMEVSPSTIRRLHDRDELPLDVIRLGQRWVIPSAPVRKLLHIA
jgi:hypothetical protein